jgi:GNAT superfamily N-acetyltransferase
MEDQTKDVVLERATPDALDALGRFADRVFRPDVPAGLSMPREFPLLFHSDNAANLFYIRRGDDVLALAGTYPQMLAVNGATVRAVSVGAVCTAPRARGQGYATALLHAIRDQFQPSHGLLLISGDRPLYRRLGAVPFGHLVQFAVERTSSVPGGTWVRACAPIEAPIARLHALYVQHPVRYLRTPAAMAAMLTATGARRFRGNATAPRLWVAGYGHDERPWAYLVTTVDAASHGEQIVSVLEWGGVRSLVVAAVAHVVAGEDAARGSGLGQPNDVELDAAVRRAGGQTTAVRNGGTLCVINPDLVARDIEPWLEEQRGDALTLTRWPGDTWRLEGRQWAEGLEPQVLDRWQLAQFVFGANGLAVPLPNTLDLNFI